MLNEPPTVTEGPIPKHLQLRAIVLDHLSRDLEPGDPIPSERELATRYGVSRATVRETVGQLVQEGHLDRVPGKGTFVAAPRIESRLHLASFTDDMRRRGLMPTTEVLSVTEQPAPPHLARVLALDDGAPVVRIARLRHADGQPMADELSYYPAQRLPGLAQADLGGSLYALLRDHYGLGPLHGEQVVTATAADPERAQRLGVPIGAPLLAFQRVTSGPDGVPIEHAVSHYRGDRYQIRMSLDTAPPA